MHNPKGKEKCLKNCSKNMTSDLRRNDNKNDQVTSCRELPSTFHFFIPVLFSIFFILHFKPTLYIYVYIYVILYNIFIHTHTYVCVYIHTHTHTYIWKERCIFVHFTCTYTICRLPMMFKLLILYVKIKKSNV